METENGIRKVRKCYNEIEHSHELTFTTYNKQPFMLYKPFCEFFIEAVNAASAKYNFAVRAFVIMSEHIHLILTPLADIYDITVISKAIKQSVSKKAINHLKKYHPEKLSKFETGQKCEKRRFWQDGGGYDRNIYTSEAFCNSVYYIHNNPVKRGLVENSEDWYYSSYRLWSGTGDSPTACLKGRLKLMANELPQKHPQAALAGATQWQYNLKDNF